MTNPSQLTRFQLSRCITIFISCCLALSSLASAQDPPPQQIRNIKGADLKLMNNHDPQSQIDNFVLLPDYEVNLFASDPMIANPVHMHWDSRGRLWVACSWAYPQLKPGEKPNDKIIILEDTDNDGVADKSTVFADGLYLPTGIELANGGCYVAQSPDVFFLKDTDGDDVADVKELVLTGFGIEDSHHSISAWRRGPGGWLYFQEGIFLHAQVETQRGMVRNFNGGIYQFNPRSQELRMFCRGTGGNPWGHVFDRWGQSFMVNNPRIIYITPTTGNTDDALRPNILVSTEKQCGGDLATGRHVGDDLRGQLLTGRFKSRTVVRYEFIEKDAGFSANVLQPLIQSKHPNFRPVDVKVGPEGAVYVADWYNSIINHAAHDFRDPRRDHEHGRIWRITHKTRPLVEKPKLVDISIEEQIEHLKSPEAWTRHQARKELSERDPDKVLAALEAWVDTLDTEDPDFEHHLVEAMWACQNVERVSEKIFQRVANASDGHARSTAARMIRYWHEQLADPIGMVTKLSGDPFPRTRMEAVLSAGFIPKAEAFTAALHSLDHPSSGVLNQALPQTMSALKPYWLPAMQAGTLTFAKPAHREFADRGAGVGLASLLKTFLKQSSPSAVEIAQMQQHLAESGTIDEVALLLNGVGRNSQALKSPQAMTAMLGTIQQMSELRKVDSLRREFRVLRPLLANKDLSVAVAAANALGDWKLASNSESKAIRNGQLQPEVKQAIAIALAKTNASRYRDSLVRLTKSNDLATRYAAAAGLAQADLKAGAEAVAKVLKDDPQDIDPWPLVKSVLQRNEGESLLSAALKDATLHPAVMKRVSEVHRDSGALPPSIASVFRPVKESGSLTAELIKEGVLKLAAASDQLGDPARGEMIFRRKSMACASCHAVGSAGPHLGPNLVAVGSAAKTKYLVESILEPDAAIAEHYETRKFLLENGRVLSGIVSRRDEKEVVVIDASDRGREVRIEVDEIEDEASGKSQMPSQLADELQNRQEFLDIVKFLSVLGKAGEYENNESPVIRKWQVIPATNPESLPAGKELWQTKYAKVSGELPAEDFPADDYVFARGQINVLVAGKVKFDISSAAGLKMWVDGNPISDLSESIELTAGQHSVTFGMDSQRAKKGLRVELQSPDGQGRFQAVGGG